MKISDFYNIYLLSGSFSVYFDIINGKEYIRAYNFPNITSYKILKDKKLKINNKSHIGTFIVNLLNNSDKIISLSENLIEHLYSVNNNLHTTYPTDSYEYNVKYNRNKLTICKIDEAISHIKALQNNIDKIFIKTSKKSGYVAYNSTVVSIPNATISHKKPKLYIYKYEISNLEDLFNTSIHSIYLSKHKIYKCTVCHKYFISNKLKKTCSPLCETMSKELNEEEDGNRAREKKSDEVKSLLKAIRGVLGRYVKNKKENIKRTSMLEDFNNRYDKKIKALDKRYKTHNNNYEHDLVQWLEKEYKKVQTAFPSKKYGNKNRLIK